MGRFLEITSGEEYFKVTNLKTNKSSVVKPSKDGLILTTQVDGDDFPTPFRWYGIVPIIKDIVSDLVKFDESRPLPAGKEKCPSHKREEWNRVRTTKMVAKAITDEWRKLLSIDRFKRYIEFDRKFTSVVGTQKSLRSNWNWLYNIEHDVWTNQYLYNDVLTYKPAMMLFSRNCYQEGRWTSPDSDYISSTDWKRLFSINGDEPYKALNKTLFSINYSIPINLLLELKNKKLEKPLLTRAELIAYLTTNSYYTYIREDIKNIVLKSTPKEFRKVAKYLRSVDYAVNLRKSGGYSTLISYLRDFQGESYHGDLMGLAKRSFTYHELIRQNRLKKRIDIDPATLTKVPPFDFTKVKGIKHLATVQDVVDEGRIMGHCVASYAKSAVKGDCYLFHLDHPTTKEKATIEINLRRNYWTIGQCQGPGNKQNSASKYAKAKFDEIFAKLNKNVA